jgi:5'-3' exonuclease
LDSQNGYSTQAVYGYLKFLLSLIEEESPEYIAAAFDESRGNCF